MSAEGNHGLSRRRSPCPSTATHRARRPRGQGLGIGGERLHYWVMNGPWTYETDHDPGAAMSEPDRGLLRGAARGPGRRHCGRGMYDSPALGWHEPVPGDPGRADPPTEDQPDESTGFVMVDGFDAAFAAPGRRPPVAVSPSAAVADTSDRRSSPAWSTSSASPPPRSSWAVASGSSRVSTTTSTSRSCRSTTLRTPSTRGTPSGADAALVICRRAPHIRSPHPGQGDLAAAVVESQRSSQVRAPGRGPLLPTGRGVAQGRTAQHCLETPPTPGARGASSVRESEPDVLPVPTAETSCRSARTTPGTGPARRWPITCPPRAAG